MSNLISLLALAVSFYVFGHTIIPRHHLSYLVRTDIDMSYLIRTESDTSYLNDETKIAWFLSSTNHMLFFNSGNQTETVIDVYFTLIRNDTSKIILKNKMSNIEPFVLESGKNSVITFVDFPIAEPESNDQKKFGLLI